MYKNGCIIMFTYIPILKTDFDYESHLTFIKNTQTLKHWL